MKFRFIKILVFLIFFPSLAFTEEGNTDVSFYTGTFDVIDKEGDDQTSLLGIEHKNSDLFIMPSIIATDGDRDGLPNVLMEAASKKVCCIATDLPGIKEFIKHNETGLIVPSANSQELMRSIISLSQNPAKRVRLAEAANKLLATNFSHSKNVREIIKLLRREVDTNGEVLKDIL